MIEPFKGTIKLDVRDSTPDWGTAATFKGGTILQVEVNVGDDQYVDLEKEAAAMMARE